MTMLELHRVEGIARKSGVDFSGSPWIECDTSGYLDVNEGECDECGAQEPDDAYVCGDGGDMVCAAHVVLCCTADNPCEHAPKV